jgi:hypothetical protein
MVFIEPLGFWTGRGHFDSDDAFAENILYRGMKKRGSDSSTAILWSDVECGDEGVQPPIDDVFMNNKMNEAHNFSLLLSYE